MYVDTIGVVMTFLEAKVSDQKSHHVGRGSKYYSCLVQ